MDWVVFRPFGGYLNFFAKSRSFHDCGDLLKVIDFLIRK